MRSSHQTDSTAISRVPRLGRIQDFPKGGVETRDTKCGGGDAVRFRLDTKYRGGGGGWGGGGVLSASGPIQKAGEGGGVLSASVPLRKAGGGGGGGGVFAVRRFRPDTKSGGGGGCLAEEGADRGPYMKGGVATPKPPPPLDPPLHRAIVLVQLQIVDQITSSRVGTEINERTSMLCP